ncbi:MAG: hypothetical protein KKG59_01485 [Nanoarchaeota archaeon]|nr:hypothetical protein [Nanoarchaeota archaeon]
MAAKTRTKPHHIIILVAVLVGLSLIFIFQFFDPEPDKIFMEEEDVLVKIKDVESGFGTLEDYQSTADSEDTQSFSFKIEKDDRELNLGTQIIKQATKEETLNLFELHLEDLISETPSENKDIPIGERGKLIKIPMSADGSISTFYILYYKDTSFVILTLNFAKEEDESDLLNLARSIEKRLD